MSVKTWSKLNAHLNCFHSDCPVKFTPFQNLKLKTMCPMTMKKARSYFKCLISKNLWKFKGISYPWIFKGGCILSLTHTLLREQRLLSAMPNLERHEWLVWKSETELIQNGTQVGKNMEKEGFRENDLGRGRTNKVIFTKECECKKPEFYHNP